MSTITQTQFIEDTLRSIGHIGPNDSADAEDTTYVQRMLTAMLERIEEDSLTDWDITGAIPVGRQKALQTLLVLDIADTYGVQVAEGAQERAEAKLRYAANRPFVNRERVTDY